MIISTSLFALTALLVAVSIALLLSKKDHGEIIDLSIVRSRVALGIAVGCLALAFVSRLVEVAL